MNYLKLERRLAFNALIQQQTRQHHPPRNLILSNLIFSFHWPVTTVWGTTLSAKPSRDKLKLRNATPYLSKCLCIYIMLNSKWGRTHCTSWHSRRSEPHPNPKAPRERVWRSGWGWIFQFQRQARRWRRPRRFPNPSLCCSSTSSQHRRKWRRK